MRVAVCLSGLIGYSKKLGKGKIIDFYKTKKYFDKNLLHNINADHFLHCWDKDFKKDLIHLYKPKDFIFENSLENTKNIPAKHYGALSNNYSKKKLKK